MALKPLIGQLSGKHRRLRFHSSWAGALQGFHRAACSSLKDTKWAPKPSCHVNRGRNARWPKRGDPHGHGASVVVSGRESRPHGEGRQVRPGVEAELGKRVMRKADVILDIHRDRYGYGSDELESRMR